MKIQSLINAYDPLLNRLLEQSNGIEYSFLFMEPDSKAISAAGSAEAFDQMRKVYLWGILERAHLACITSIARSGRWLESTGGMIKAENALGFSASLRGFLESAADAHDVMAFLPSSLDKLFKYLYLVSVDSKDVENMLVAPGELENRLIHYAYAKRQPRGATALPHHKNKTNAAYIETIEQFGVTGAVNLYGELCELTHPAAASVSCFLDEGKTSITFNSGKDISVIDDLCSRYENTIEQLAQYTINPALMGLCYLHRLVDEWPAPLNEEMSGIGKFLARLSAIDQFVNDYVEGTVNRATLAKELQ